MSEDVILSEIKDELKNLKGTINTQTNLLRDMRADMSAYSIKQVFSMKELAIRWNCSEPHAREIVREFKFPLVKGADGNPRKPYCVLRIHIEEYEKEQSEDLKEKISITPSRGKTARGFNPFAKKGSTLLFKGKQRLGDLIKK